MTTTLRKNHNTILQGVLLTSFSNRRVNIRYEVEQEVNYVLHDKQTVPMKGVLINISDAGVGLFVFSFLQEGQAITIKSDDKTIHRQAVVRWCRQMGENIYKAGLEFVGGESV